MEANPTIAQNWDDLVFEHRNKLYGAYLLRRAYPDHLIIGLIATIVVVVVIISLQNTTPRVTTSDETSLLDEGVVTLTELPRLPERTKSKSVIHQPEKSVKKDTAPLVTTDEVIPETEVEAITEYVSGDEEGSGSGVVGTIEGIGTIALPDPDPIGNGPIDMAEVMPSYDGGMEAMMKFIQKKLRYPRVPLKLGIDGTVYVRFVVRGDGRVTDVEVIRGIHRDCDEEAARVVAMLPAWKGGSHHGRPVSVRMVLPIRFSLER